MNMKDYWTQKLDGYGYGFDTKIVLDEYDRNVTKLEALQNKFKPGYTVKYKGVAMAIAKKALGNTKDYYKEIKKFLPKEEERKKSLASDEELINLMLKVFGVVDEDYS